MMFGKTETTQNKSGNAISSTIGKRKKKSTAAIKICVKLNLSIFHLFSYLLIYFLCLFHFFYTSFLQVFVFFVFSGVFGLEYFSPVLDIKLFQNLLLLFLILIFFFFYYFLHVTFSFFHSGFRYFS